MINSRRLLSTARLVLVITALIATALPPAAQQDVAVAKVLDDFHDAAAKADEKRYFAHFTPDAVFMGTDATERWTVDAFKKFAAPHFQKKSAWTFVPKDRYVVLSPRGDVAWFDEVVDSEHMGACRGTGVLRKIDGTWRIAHYNLTLPIPNDLMKAFSSRIRTHLDGASGAAKPAVRDTVVFIVRHAEKEAGRDPGLTAVGTKRAETLATMLAKERLTAAYSSQFKRTRDTIAPAAKAAGIQPTVVGARDVRRLAKLIRESAGGRIVVAGHSNTVPMLIRALGVKREIRITEKDYGNLFVVRLGASGPTLLNLTY